MRNLPQELRGRLKNLAEISALTFEKKLGSRDRSASKYLFKTYDGFGIETVELIAPHTTTLCISSQIGCPLKCTFCATGSRGFRRNLKVSEILAQYLFFKKNITNIVFMGMGEPLLNYSNVMKAVRILNSPDCVNFGARRMTISTCGIPDKIRKLGSEGLEFNLSISLNSPNNRTRSILMPINRKYNIEELLKATNNYIQRTSRRVTFEYILIKGVNDTIKDAKELAALLRDLLCHVNLIPFNPIKQCKFVPSSFERILFFRQILAQNGINATIRKSKGADISAACGQLMPV